MREEASYPYFHPRAPGHPKLGGQPGGFYTLAMMMLYVEDFIVEADLIVHQYYCQTIVADFDC